MLKSRASIRCFKVLYQHYSACHSGIYRLHTLSSSAHENAAAYYHFDCISIALPHTNSSIRGKLSFPNVSPSVLIHIRFLEVPKDKGENHLYINGPWTVPAEGTEIVSDRIRESQVFYGNDDTKNFAETNSRSVQEQQLGKRVGLGEKTNILVDRLLKLKDSKEAVYGALDSWVALEKTFPSSVVKRALYMLEKKQRWHRIIQVIKWMLSKGQCMTMNTYEQLLRALDKDGRAEEAHTFWKMRIGSNLHSVPWQLCTFMICMYEQNNMPERLIKLFNDLETHNRKPPDKTIIKTVADAYQLLGLLEEQERVLEKYCRLKESSNCSSKKKKGEKKVQNRKS